MKILVTGASGLVGTAVIDSLNHKGDQIFRLLRSPAYQNRSTDIVWDPENGQIDTAHLEGMDAVVHLAGESISSGRWTKDKKEKIRNSRIVPTQNLSTILSRLTRPPKVFVSASAIGFYGDRADQLLDEKSLPGEGFLSSVCQEWEKATIPAQESGIRVVKLRFGIILSSQGGALAQMLLPFRLGLGGRLGGGNQYMSWIDIGDVVDIIQYVLRQEKLDGAINAVSPHPVTNTVFTKTLGNVLRRPTLFPAPRFALKLGLGEMAEALLLSSTRVMPEALLINGFRFRYPDLKPSLQHLLTR